MRLRAKVDANQKAIVAALRKCGCLVASLAAQGDGIPDLLVYIPRQARYLVMEVKNPNGRGRRLTEDQKRVHAVWPVEVVCSVEDALRVVGVEG